METFAFYLIKSSVWLTGFSLVYFLFLRNERFFVLNRFFLLAGIMASTFFPLFTWHYTVVLPVVPSVEVSGLQVQGMVPAEKTFPVQNTLLLIYFAGTIFLTYRTLKQTLPVFRIIKNSGHNHFNSVKLIRTAEYPASFSFISFVFVNPSISDTETNEIVNHEAEHIRQRHWIDLLLFEILRTMQWFNPASWLYGRFIRQNHEYLADERALQRSSNPAVYRAALLNQMFGGPVITLANSFNYSLNKKRFNMMKHIVKSPFRKLKLLLILPLMAGVFYAFSAPEYRFVQAASTLQSQEIKTVTGKVVSEDGKPLKGANVVISGKTIGTTTDANGNFKLELTDDSPLVISYVGFESQKVNPDFEKEMVITLKTMIVGIDQVGNDVSANKSQQSPEPSLIIIDGKESTKKVMTTINPERIDRVNVLKGENAVKKYGKKGKDGVIEITLKSGDDAKAGETFKVKTDSPLKFGNANGSANQPLYVVDGKITDNQNLNNLSPETIESIDVLKGESATKLYGEKGKNGVILITAKKGTSDIKKESVRCLTGNFISLNSIDKTQASSDINFNAKTIQGVSKNGITVLKADSISADFSKTNSLLFIDGKESTNAEVNRLNPDKIESVSVLKDKTAISKYGEKGKNGVIEITTKKTADQFTAVEQMPEFPGGILALKTFVAATMKYPADALEKSISGKVFVNFIVAKDGSVTAAKVAKGVDPSLDKEALRIVESMPKWNPGRQNGEVVDVAYSLPINFSIPQKKINKQKLK